MKFLLLILWLTLGVAAGEFQVRGIIGNSGVAGSTLLTSGEKGLITGLAWDAVGKHFWLINSRQRLVKIDIKGRLVAGFEIPGIDKAETLPVRLAIAGKSVFALFRANKKILMLPLDAEPGTTMKRFQLSKDLDWELSVGMGGTSVSGKLIIGNGKSILAVEPDSGKFATAFEAKEEILEQGLATSQRKIIYLTTGVRTTSYHLDGTELRFSAPLGAPMSAVKEYAIGFNKDKVRLASWDLKSVDNLSSAGGVELGQISQAVYLNDQTIAAAGISGCIYIGKITDNSILWQRRYGAIKPLGIGVNTEGHVFATISHIKGRSGGIVAWNWRADPNGSPDYDEVCKMTMPFNQLHADDNDIWGAFDLDDNGVSKVAVWHFSLNDGKTRYVTIGGKRPPQPIGMCRLGNTLLFISEGNLDIFAMPLPGNADTSKDAKTLGWAGTNPLTSPNQLAPWSQNRFLVVNHAKIILIQRTPGGLTSLWDFDSWASDKFGDKIYIATSGDYLFVSDTKRHRVLAFDILKRELVAQLGETDKPGSAKKLSNPTFISASGDRIAVYDSGNERIVKLKFKP